MTVSTAPVTTTADLVFFANAFAKAVKSFHESDLGDKGYLVGKESDKIYAIDCGVAQYYRARAALDMKDYSTVIEAANEAGYHDIFRKSLIPLTEMEKLMGKQDFQSILGDLIVKPAGKPTLVPASDKRPAITSANTDFMKIKED